MSNDIKENITKLVKKGKENGFILIDELDSIMKSLSIPDQQYIRDSMEEMEIQVVKAVENYDEYKYMTGEEAIQFLQELSDGKTKAFVKDEKGD